MTPQENQALQIFLTQLVQARGVAKDPQAEAAILQAAAQQPDAAYLLVLRCMQQEQALTAANAQIAKLQADLQAARSAQAPAGAPGTFLDPNAGAAWGAAPAAPAYAPRPAAPAYPPAAPAYQQAAPAYQPAPAYQQAPAQPSGFFSGGVGSFLGNVATTAAGVAAGTFLVQGIESLFDGHSGHGGGQGAAAYDAPVPTEQNITVNNYYESDAQDGGDYQDTASQDDYVSDDDSNYA
ncbi:DUF2076 family protein [Chromobacterium sp. CV08]|uniref:DUF2076 family protein n=1 Tax=Chromobacterium sp. CV08 TaxID=3133274 RepID=UPI003DA7BA59